MEKLSIIRQFIDYKKSITFEFHHKKNSFRVIHNFEDKILTGYPHKLHCCEHKILFRFSGFYFADPYSFFESGYYNKDSIKNKAGEYLKAHYGLARHPGTR